MEGQRKHFARVKPNGWGALALFGMVVLIGSADWWAARLASVCCGAEGEVVRVLAGVALSTLDPAGSTRHGIWDCLFQLTLLFPYVAFILGGAI